MNQKSVRHHSGALIQSMTRLPHILPFPTQPQTSTHLPYLPGAETGERADLQGSPRAEECLDRSQVLQCYTLA